MRSKKYRQKTVEEFKEEAVEKRLYRSRRNRMIAGICGGMGEYFNIDPTVIRILAVIFLLVFNIMTVIAYLVLAIVIPLEPSTTITPRQ
jgi:phage shock protein C